MSLCFIPWDVLSPVDCYRVLPSGFSAKTLGALQFYSSGSFALGTPDIYTCKKPWVNLVGAERHVTQLLFLSLPTALKTSDIRVRRSCIIQPPEIHAAKSRCMGTQRESSQVAQISKSAQPTHRIMSQIKG